MSKEAGSFFQRFKDELVKGLNTILIGKIEKFDATKAKADVKLLNDDELILGVPVAMPQTSNFMIRMPYKKGDYVVVAFAQRDIDSVLYGGGEEPSERMLSIDDAIVIGGINLFTNTLPSTNASDLVVASKDLNDKITISSDGNIRLENGAGAKITMDNTGAIDIIGPNGVTITGKSSTATY